MGGFPAKIDGEPLECQRIYTRPEMLSMPVELFPIKNISKGTFQKSELAGQTKYFDNETGFYKEFFFFEKLSTSCLLFSI